MKTIYTFDSNQVYSGVFEVEDEFLPVPAGADIEPPKLNGAQVARWSGENWEVLDSYPVTPMTVNPAPFAVSMRQARLALLNAGLLSQVDAAIARMPSPQKEAAQIEWEYAAEVQRTSGIVPQLGAALGLDDDALDALFTAASNL